jgi:hypothetical protein
MKKEDAVLGMKVVPYKKSAKGWTSLENSIAWNNAKNKNQPYLYLTEIDAITGNGDYCQVLNDEKWDLDGDYFMWDDFEPYVETPILIPKSDTNND